MKIVVTGALGHIGSLAIRELPSLFPGAGIVLIDNLVTQRYCSLFDLPAGGRYRFTEADVLEDPLEPLFEGADAVIHLAAATDAAGSFDQREHVESVNFRAVERVARACVATGSALVYPSTTSVYGTQSEVVDEECPESDLNPQSPYAESKLRAERMLRDIGESEGLRFVTLRLGTIFGVSPGMRFHTAVNKFIWQACLGLPVTVWRTAMDQRRPYLDIGDAVAAFGFFLRERRFDGQIYNVLTLNATVREILDAVLAEVDDLKVEYVDTRIMNQLSYAVLSRKVESAGFSFRGSLADRVRESVALLRNARSIELRDPSCAGTAPRHEGNSR